MSFCAAVNCIDGRSHAAVVAFAKRRFRTRWVDLITEPAPVRILADDVDRGLIDSILRRVDLSIRAHRSSGIVVAAHYGCAANPCDEETQRAQVERSVELLRSRYPDCEVVGVWVDRTWTAEEVPVQATEGESG